MGCLDEDAGKGCCCYGIVSLIIFLIVLISGSLNGVEPTELGMVFSYWDKAPVKGDFWKTGGLWWTGYWTYVIKYPYTYQGIEFSNDKSTRDYTRLNTRTAEGLDLSVSFSFTFQYIKEKIPDLYRVCELDCKDLIAKIAKNSVLEVAGTWKASDYWLNRDTISDSMK